jgi:hypothetical protein
MSDREVRPSSSEETKSFEVPSNQEELHSQEGSVAAHLSSSSTSITSITGTTMTYKVTINGVEIMIIATPKSLANRGKHNLPFIPKPVMK